jgi:hypothetical protein
VQRVVDPPVPGAGEAVADLVAGGGVDRGGAVVAGEGVLSGEPCHVAGLSQDPPGDHRADIWGELAMAPLVVDDLARDFHRPGQAFAMVGSGMAPAASPNKTV